MRAVILACLAVGAAAATAACAAPTPRGVLGPTGVGSCRTEWQERIDDSIDRMSFSGDVGTIRSAIVEALPKEEATILLRARAEVLDARRHGKSLNDQQDLAFALMEREFTRLRVCGSREADSQMYYFGDAIYVAIKARFPEGIETLELDSESTKRDGVYTTVWSLVGY